jgi:glutathione peroxidase
MKTKITLALIAIICSAFVTVAAFSRAGHGSPSVGAASSIYDFSLKDIDGKQVSLSQYRGKVTLLVNVASKCGLTPQYEALQRVYQKYQDKGFVILGFPANNFMGQEPGTEQEIKSFCSIKYNVTFPMFSKISVKGENIHPLYQFLTSKETDPEFSGDIKWNFNKFLVDRNGKIIARFEPPVKPDAPEVIQAIEKALQ